MDNGIVCTLSKSVDGNKRNGVVDMLEGRGPGQAQEVGPCKIHKVEQSPNPAPRSGLPQT